MARESSSRGAMPANAATNRTARALGCYPTYELGSGPATLRHESDHHATEA